MPIPTPHDPNRPASKGGLPVAKLLPPVGPPPRPPSAAGGNPAARRQPPPPPAADPGFDVVDDDAGFEVVEDTAPARPAKGKTHPDPGFDVVDDDESPRKRKRAVEADDDGDDDRPRKKKRPRDEDDEDDDGPKKKRKKKRKGVVLTPEEEAAEKERENAMMEWAVPSFLAFVGLVMTIIASVKVVGPAGLFLALGSSALMTIIIIPVTVAALMVIGMMVGIEYGTPLSAIRNLTAIVLLIQGITWLGLSLGLCMITFAVTPLITFGLFMTLFRLDVWETWITVSMLDALQKAFGLLFFMVIVVAISKSVEGGMSGPDPGDDPPPAWNGGGGGGGFRPAPGNNFDDD